MVGRFAPFGDTEARQPELEVKGRKALVGRLHVGQHPLDQVLGIVVIPHLRDAQRFLHQSEVLSVEDPDQVFDVVFGLVDVVRLERRQRHPVVRKGLFCQWDIGCHAVRVITGEAVDVGDQGVEIFLGQGLPAKYRHHPYRTAYLPPDL